MPVALPARLDPDHATGCHQTHPHHHRELAAGDWLAAVTAATDGTGFRLTAARTTLLVWIARRDGSFGVDELANAAGSRATTYRFVRWLRTEGWVARTALGRRAGGDGGYVRHLPGHARLVCLDCGLALLIGGWNLDERLAPVLASTGYHLHGHVLELQGRCVDCTVRLAPSA